MSADRIFVALTLAAGLWIGVSPARAQPGSAPNAKLKAKQLKQKAFPLLPLPNPAMDRFLHMSPEEQQSELAQLPPERRAQAEQRLRRYQQLTSEQRAQLDERARIFESLIPRR